MRIVNKKKFVRMIILIVGIISILFICFSNISFSKGEIKTKSIYVSSGDTLWTIATEEQENNSYYEDKDIRDIIYEIKKIEAQKPLILMSNDIYPLLDYVKPISKIGQVLIKKY